MQSRRDPGAPPESVKTIGSEATGWNAWLVGIIPTLYVVRLIVELGPASWPVAITWLVALVMAGLSLAAVIAGQRCGLALGPLAVLGLYVISPVLDLRLAAATGFLGLAGSALSLRRRCPGHTLDLAIFLTAFLVYIATLSPGLLPADSGEFQFVAPTLGIAHPPGYALYTLVGRIFTLIPLDTPAWRLNLLSALLAAATLVLVNRTARLLTCLPIAGLVAALALAGSTTFWTQATTTNVRMPSALFTAVLLWLLVRYGETRAPRGLMACAFVFGLGIVHHGSLAFLAFPAAIYLLGTDPSLLTQGRLMLQAGLAFAASLPVLLYFPIRGAAGNAPLDPGRLTTLDGLLWHVLAQGFQHDVLYFTDPTTLLDRLAVLRNILEVQFGWPLLVLATIGLIPPVGLLRLRRSRFSMFHWVLVTGALLILAFVAITYRAAQTVEYLMPAYVALALAIAVGAGRLVALSSSLPLRGLFLALSLLPSLANIIHSAPSFITLRQREDTRATTEPVLRAAPPRATILADWHWATPFWYLQTVEGQRSDLEVQYVVPASADQYGETWRRRLGDAAARRSVIVTNRLSTYSDLPFSLLPFRDFFQASLASPTLPPDAIPLNVEFGGALRLVAHGQSQSQLSPGGTLAVPIWWQPLPGGAGGRDHGIFVHLTDTRGIPVAQHDVTYPAAALRAGQLLGDSHRLPVLLTVPPGEYTLVAGVYVRSVEGSLQRLTTPHGDDLVRLTTVNVVPGDTAPVTRHPLDYPFAGGPTLVGVDYDTSRDDSTRVYLHWRMPGVGGPWTPTLVTSGEWVAQTELVPALAGSFLTTALDMPPDQPQLGLQVIDRAGGRLAPQGAWRLPLADSRVDLPRVVEGDRYLVFGGEMALVRANVEQLNGQAVIDLAWISFRPLLRDYRISVQLRGDSWRAQHDGPPALGAIPTLKWSRGTQVSDRHRIHLADQAMTRGDIQVAIAVYDAFSQYPLGVLDERFQRVGQGQRAVIGVIKE